MVFGPSGAGDPTLMELGSTQPYFKYVVTNFGVKIARDLKMDMQTVSVVKSSFISAENFM